MKNDNVMFPILLSIVFISFGILTFLHDPLLHSIPALIYGWSIENWSTGVLTGETTVTTTDATMWQLWWYYMLPPITLCFSALLITFLKPSRIIAIPCLIIFMLNLASLDPTIVYSDSYNGLRTLLESDFPIIYSYGIHYGLFILSLMSFAFFIYLMFEDNPNDAIKRRNNTL